MTDAWHYMQDGQQYGPIEMEALRNLARAGGLKPTDRIRQEGAEDWVPSHAVPGVFPGPPPLPATRRPIGSAVAPTESSRPPPSVVDATAALDQPHASAFDPGSSDAIQANEIRNAFQVEIDSTIKDFRTLDYGFLLPFKKLASTTIIGSRAVRWVLGFGLFPLVVMYLQNLFGLTIAQCAFAIGGYFSFFWATYFHGLIRPSGTSWRRGLRFALFTSLVGIPLLLFAQTFPIIRSLYSGTESQSFLVRVFGFVLAVGPLEELCKAAPLLIFAMRRGETISYRDGVFLGMMSGFGFAVTESVGYSLMYWNHAAEVSSFAIGQRYRDGQAVHSALAEFYGTVLLMQIVRFMTLPLLHAAWAGIVGWFVATASVRPRGRAVVAVGIAFVAVVHGFYDVFANGLIGLAIAAATIIVFMTYLVHGHEVAASPDFAAGDSGAA